MAAWKKESFTHGTPSGKSGRSVSHLYHRKDLLKPPQSVKPVLVVRINVKYSEYLSFWRLPGWAVKSQQALNIHRSSCGVSALRWPFSSRGTLPADGWTWVLTALGSVRRTSQRDVTLCRWKAERKSTAPPTVDDRSLQHMLVSKRERENDYSVNLHTNTLWFLSCFLNIYWRELQICKSRCS